MLTVTFVYSPSDSSRALDTEPYLAIAASASAAEAASTDDMSPNAALDFSALLFMEFVICSNAVNAAPMATTEPTDTSKPLSMFVVIPSAAPSVRVRASSVPIVTPVAASEAEAAVARLRIISNVCDTREVIGRAASMDATRRPKPEPARATTPDSATVAPTAVASH